MKGRDSFMDKFALTLTIIGAFNWLCVALFRFDIVAWMFGGSHHAIARLIYGVIGVAGLWCLGLLFRRHEGHRHAVDTVH